ncbi:MAG TPA: glycosyltransferase family 4 protein [Lacunisphaera sp.]|nr:glycosyltransferase family 4 protein [Lacunisphaera sp.]
MSVLLAHPGTQHAFRLARELDQRGLLGEFWTGLALRDGGMAASLATRGRAWPLAGGLTSRVARGITPSRLHNVAWNEIRALVRMKTTADHLAVIHERNRAFQDAIPDENILRHSAIIGFDTSSWRLAERAGRLGRPFHLDRTIAHPAVFTRLQDVLRRRYPDWFPPAQARPDFLVQAEAAEHRDARRILVGSSFARDSLVQEGVPREKITVNPYGVDWSLFSPRKPAPAPGSGRPLRFAFVGSHIGRKGLPVLLEAWRALAPQRGDAELWLAGPCGPQEQKLLPALPGLCVLGRVPHAEIPGLLAETDIFVLPSLQEGFSLALLEAVASGLAVIATPNTGAADVLVDPVLGRLVSAGSVDALVAALQHYLAHPPDRQAVRAACVPLQPLFSWEAYGDRWAALLRETS